MDAKNSTRRDNFFFPGKRFERNIPVRPCVTGSIDV
jgi:hypothetical protein